MSQGQSTDPNLRRQPPQSQPQPSLQPQHSSPNVLPSALPRASHPNIVPAISMPLPAQGPYGTPSNLRYFPPDHAFSAALRNMPVLNLEAPSLRMQPQNWNMLHGQSIDPTVQHYPSPAPPHPTQVLWPNYRPGNPSMPPGQMYSRLPPDSVARKAPRKSAVSTTEALRSEGGADPAQRRASKLEHRQRRDTPGQPGASGRESPAQGTALHGYHNSIKSLQALQAGQHTTRRPSQSTPQTQPAMTVIPSRSNLSAAARGRPIILEDDDDNDGDGEYVDENVIIPSIEVDESSSPAPPVSTARRSRRRPENAKKPPRPPLRYANTLPYGMKGMRAALGDDNWNEYCVLIEKKILGQITEEEFTAQSRAIFMVAQVVDEQTRTRMEKRIAKEVVMPMIAMDRGSGVTAALG